MLLAAKLRMIPVPRVAFFGRNEMVEGPLEAGRLQSRLADNEAGEFECAVWVVAGAAGGFGEVGFAFQTQD